MFDEVEVLIPFSEATINWNKTFCLKVFNNSLQARKGPTICFEMSYLTQFGYRMLAYL